MKKRLSGLLAGILIGSIMTGSIAFAANGTTLYDVITNGIKIVIDGKELHPKDVNGNTVEPMIYNGTTYLPVRAVADALGKAVYWDGPNYTVYLGSMSGSLTYPTVEMEDMTNIASNKYGTTDDLTDNYGNNYDHAVCNRWGSGGQYLLNMKYSRFQGTLYVPEGYAYDGTYYLTIKADGKTIYKSPEMTRTSSPQQIDLNITGCNNFEIEFSSLTASSYLRHICLGNAGFYQ